MYQYDQIQGYIDTFLFLNMTVNIIHRFYIDYPLSYQSIRVKYSIFIGWFTNTLSSNLDKSKMEKTELCYILVSTLPLVIISLGKNFS